MKTTLFIFISLFLSLASAAENYDSYNDIVDKLSAQRDQTVRTKMGVTLPTQERFQLSLGLTNASTTIEHANVGGVSQNGFVFGVAIPVISQQLFAEGFAGFFKAAQDDSSSTSLRQFEARLTHKEPLSFALLNVGAGFAARFFDVETSQGDKSVQTPNLLLTTGLERRLTERMSVAGDLGYYRSLNNNENAKNSVAFTLRMNYHL